MKQLSKELLLLLCAVVSCGAAWAQESVAWVKVTDYSNLSTNDTYVIAGNGISGGVTTWYSLKNDPVSTKKVLPIGSILTITGNLITSPISKDETWTLEAVSGTTDVYYIKSTKGNYYLEASSSTESFIRETGTAAFKQWKIHYTDTNDKAIPRSVTGLYLPNTTPKREMAVFDNGSEHNWRSYSPDNYNNIDKEEVVLYRKMIVVSISSAQYASFCSNCSLDFSGTGMTVYKAKGTESAVTLTRVEDGIVPANTGVVLYSESAMTCNVPVTSATGITDWSDNELVGITERTKISVNGAEGKTNYILSKEGNVVGFYLAASGDGAYLAANRAYLSTLSTTSAAQYLGFEEETTSLSDMRIEEQQKRNDQFYDLGGRRVAEPTTGIYIIKGKKVFIK